jgi:hypothetical protein
MPLGQFRLVRSGNTGIGMNSHAVLGQALRLVGTWPRHRCRALRSRRNGSCALPRRICRRHSRRSRFIFSVSAFSSAIMRRCSARPWRAPSFSCLRPGRHGRRHQRLARPCSSRRPGIRRSRASTACRSRHCRGTSPRTRGSVAMERKADHDAAFRLRRRPQSAPRIRARS